MVTVLFADLVGFTGLAEQLDPEQVKRLVDGAFERLVDDVVSFGGRVDKILGDGILALFGAPVAHEDDAERAVRAALRMQESLADHGLVSEFGGSLRMRIGINTGEVLVGTLAGSDYTAMGDVVNTASRIQGEAPPGGVLVGEATHALTEGVIEYGEERVLQPRGREQTISTWLALDALTAPGVRNRRNDLEFVGRTRELALLQAAVDHALADSRALLVSVVGESGVGKSRLVAELVGELGDAALLLEGACAPYGESNVWSPVANALATHLGLDPHRPQEVIRAAAMVKARGLMGAERSTAELERTVEVFLHLLGHPTSLDGLEVVQLRDVIHRAVGQVIERRCEKGPMLLWIDDLHWADQVVVDLLEHLVSTCSRYPFVVVTSMRPGSEVVWPPQLESGIVVSLQLQPLSRDESDELALELLHDAIDGDDERLLGSLFDRSGGNPLFLQELASLVAAEGASSELPESLRALIAARLDQLSPPERQMLDNAATLGLSGTVQNLERFAGAMRQDWDVAVLRSLDTKGFLEVQAKRWHFRSDLVREAAYHMLTKTSRAQRHAGVFRSISTHAPTALDDLAHHSAPAAEIVSEMGQVEGVPSTILADAVKALTAAAERARETGSPRIVVRHASRAIDLLAGDVSAIEQRLRLMLVRAAGLIDVRNYAAARTDIDTVLAAGGARRDGTLEGDARALLGTIHHLEGNRERARAELGRAVALLRAAKATRLLAGALRQRGFIELFGGSLVDTEWFFSEAEAEYRQLGDERGLAYVEQYRAWSSFLSGDLERADARLHHAAETLNRLGDRNGVGWAFGLLAFVRFFQRRFDEAEDLAVLVAAEASDRGDDWAAAMMQTLLADLRLWQGHLEEALSFAEQARQRFRRLGDKFGLVQSLSALIRVQVALGRTSSVQRSSEELLTLAEASPLGPVPLLAVAGAAMHRGDGATAEGLVERAIAQMVDMRAGSFEALVVRAIAQAQQGRLDEALVTIEQVDETSVDHPFAMVGRALVHALAGEAELAVEEAEVIASTPGSTYLDRAIAATAAAGAHARLGHAESAAAVLDQALEACLPVGDVVATALLQRTYLHVVGVAHRSGAGEPSHLGPGWQQVVASLPVLGRVA